MIQDKEYFILRLLLILNKGNFNNWSFKLNLKYMIYRK